MTKTIAKLAKLTKHKIERLLEESGTIDRFFSELAQCAIKSEDEKLFNVVEFARYRKENLDRLAKRLREKGDEVARSVNRLVLHSSLNSLGELQGLSSEFEIACALHGEAMRRLKEEIDARG